jgi:hypothetical protein
MSKQGSRSVRVARYRLDCAQFIAGDRLLDGWAVLKPAHPQSGPFDINLVAPQSHSLAHAQAVAMR